MANSNRITKVAIVGAGGNSGNWMTKALLQTGKHTITALTRMESQSKLPEGVISQKVDYNKPDTLVEALRGQDALVITLSGHIPKDTEIQLINAAGEAGVTWILPNEWSPDSANEALVKDVSVFQPKVATRMAIEDLVESGIPPCFGIDFSNHTVTFFDEGETKISISTWPQVGRAVAALLSLPIKPEESNKEACLEKLKNRVVYINSFTISQKDMLESAFRVTGTKAEDWTITRESSQKRYSSGMKEMQEGSRIGFAKMMYTRVFYPDSCGDVEHNKGTINSLLNLPKENIDEATKAAIERSKNFNWNN